MLAWGNAVTACAICAAMFFAGWYVNGQRWSAKYEAKKAEAAQVLADATTRMLETVKKRDAALEESDKQWSAKLREANEKISSLRNSVDAGDKRLRVNVANCRAARPTEAKDSGMDSGGTAELAADARRAYFNLRAGIVTVENQLGACQSTLRTLVDVE